MEDFMIKDASKLRGRMIASCYEGVGGGRPDGEVGVTAVWKAHRKAVIEGEARKMLDTTGEDTLADVRPKKVGIIFATRVGSVGGSVETLLDAPEKDLVAAMPLMGGLGVKAKEVVKYIKEEMDADSKAGWKKFVELGAELILHKKAEQMRDDEGRAWLIIGTSEE